MAGEDLPSKLKLRYQANNADLGKIALLQGQRIYTKNGPAETNITLRDINLIREAIDRMPNVKLLIIDPIGDFIPGTVTAWSSFTVEEDDTLSERGVVEVQTSDGTVAARPEPDDGNPAHASRATTLPESGSQRP